jgi:pimeloyl-ACP methyl ester carboxylesterase
MSAPCRTSSIEQGLLVGHSIGGWIALYIASAHPEPVSRLILADAMGPEVPSAPRRS